MITGFHIDENKAREYYLKGCWGNDTLLDAWNQCMRLSSDAEYVRDNYSQYTYSEIDDRASRLARWMSEQGIRKDDVVAVQLPIWAEFVVAFIAILKIGAITCPLAQNFNETDLDRAFGLVQPRAFICPTFARKTDYEQQASALHLKYPHLTILLVDKCAPAKSRYTTLSLILESTEPIDPPHPRVSSDDIACILSTSGSTGVPKSVLLTHNNIIFSERSMAKGFSLTKSDVAYMPSPLNHAVGFFHGCIIPMLTGGRVVLDDQFDGGNATARINACGATWCMSATPFIYDILNFLDDYRTELSSLRLFLCGGAPVPPSLIERARRHGVLLCEIYGSTESCPHVYVPKENCLEWNGAWSGVAFDGIEIRIVDDAGNDVPPGVQGEELSRGPHLFVGYHGNDGANERAMAEGGWFRSGDLGYMDEAGRLRINGRKKEIIIRGGENISANEIDAHLAECPGVADSATVGMPDERLGERICTFVVPKQGCPAPSKEDVTGYLSSIGVQKRLWPERIEPIDRIPRNPMGKVQRFLLTDEINLRLAMRDKQTPEQTGQK